MTITSGTWVAECVGRTNAGPNGEDVYEVSNGSKRVCEFVSGEDDANLIAAAPEMHDSLRDILDGYENMLRLVLDIDPDDGCDAEELCGNSACKENGCVVLKAANARAAIAKAAP